MTDYTKLNKAQLVAALVERDKGTKTAKSKSKPETGKRVLVPHMPIAIKKGTPAHQLRYMRVGAEQTGLTRQQVQAINRALAGRGSNFSCEEFDTATKSRTYTRRDTQTRKADGVSFVVSRPDGWVKRVA